MILAEVRGQERVVTLLQRASKEGRLAHAYLFSGVSGVGKRATAFALAHAVVCPEKPGVGCGNCEECRRLRAGAHPDVYVEDLGAAQRERPGASSISIDQIRRLRRQISLKPVRSARKIGLIEPAEKMTTEAQDALLKTLEEPAGCATLMLVTANPDALLPTIRSRCQRLTFAPLPSDLVAELLVGGGLDAELAKEIGPRSEGSLDRARLLAAGLSDESFRELLGKFDRLDRLSIPDCLDLAASLAALKKPSRGKKAATRSSSAKSKARADADSAESGKSSESSGASERTKANSPVGEETLAIQPEGLGDVSMADLVMSALLSRLRDRVHRALGTAQVDPSEVGKAVEQVERAYATSQALARSANAHLAWDELILDLRSAAR